jgi:hypothetical protein
LQNSCGRHFFTHSVLPPNLYHHSLFLQFFFNSDCHIWILSVMLSLAYLCRYIDRLLRMSYHLSCCVRHAATLLACSELNSFNRIPIASDTSRGAGSFSFENTVYNTYKGNGLWTDVFYWNVMSMSLSLRGFIWLKHIQYTIWCLAKFWIHAGSNN